MSTTKFLAVVDESNRGGEWMVVNRERHMQDATEEQVQAALREIFQRESVAAVADTEQLRSVTLDHKCSVVTHHNRTAGERTLWFIGEE